jgi:hypothetical protein
MQFSIALIALVAAGVVNAQLPQIPSCAESCLVGPLTTDGCSSLTDFACHCQKPGLVGKVTPCLQKSCDAADQAAVASLVVSECSSAGFPITIPSNSPTTSSSLPASSVPPPATTAVPSSTPYYPMSSSTLPSTPVGTGISSSSSSAPYSHFTGAASNVKGNMAGVAAIAAAAAYLL